MKYHWLPIVLAGCAWAHLDQRFTVMTVAKLAVRAGALDDATGYAQEMLAKFGDPFFGLWLDGDYTFSGNMVLGLVAIRNGDTEAAKSYLLLSGKSPGSATLNSFGPNMSLAKDVPDAGERKAGLTFFDECWIFWKSDFGAGDKWIAQVGSGETPQVGSNLLNSLSEFPPYCRSVAGHLAPSVDGDPGVPACTWLLFLSRKGSPPHRALGVAYLSLMTVTAVTAMFVQPCGRGIGVGSTVDTVERVQFDMANSQG